MKKSLFIIAFIISGCSNCITTLYNDFNKFKNKAEGMPNDGAIRIYFDRWGDIYPDLFIDHTTFYSNNSTLENVYKNDSAVLDKVLTEENLSGTGLDSKEKIALLEENLSLKYAKKINTLSNNKKLIFFIHGFNNTAEEAYPNYQKIKSEILKRYTKDEIQIVEIYWDGLLDKGKTVNAIKIWNNSQVAAAFVGLGLRRVLSKISAKKSYVITHSHGAAVITEALFNVRRFKLSYYTDYDDGKEIVSMQQNHKLYTTPKTEFVVGMLAPAIPGTNVFDEYHQRTVEAGNVVTTDFNYRFISGFNINDEKTTKWKLASKFGSTTLACRINENKEVGNYFTDHPNVFNSIDFSTNHGSPQKKHDFALYISNEHFEDLLDSLFTN